MSAALDFLKLHAPHGPWAVSVKVPDTAGFPTQMFDSTQAGQLEQHVAAYVGKANVYFCVNFVGRKIDKKAEKEDITAALALHVDLDPRVGEDHEAERARMLGVLRGYNPPPTTIIDSGNGYNALWRLKEPYPLGEGAGREQRIADIEDRNRRIELDLGGDKCHNIDRVLRVPGTVNLPDKKKCAKGRKTAPTLLVEHHPERLYSLDDFKRIAAAPPDGGRIEVRLSGNLPRLASVDDLPDTVSQRTKMLIVQGTDPDDPTKYASRSEPLLAVCCELVRAGVDDDTIAAVILDRDFGISISVTDKPNPRKYAKRQIEQAHKHVAAEKTGRAPLTDYGNGLRLARAAGGVLRYCYTLKSWLVYRDGHWSSDAEGEVMRLCKSTVLGILDEARSEADDDRRKQIASWAAKSQSKERTVAMAYMGQSEVAVGVADLDADPMLLNVRNGTIDLRTGALRPHDPGDLITRQAAVEHVKGAGCPQFQRFVDQVMQGDSEMVAYLQRAVGYSLTGDTREQVFFMPNGGGANGKSTLLRIVATMLGDYAHTAQMSAFIAQNRNPDGPNEALAAMRGARLVLAAEIRPGAPLDEQTMKTITGGERIRARFLNQNSFEYAPEFKVWLVVNHLPRITGRDNGIWRRVRVIPFDRQFAEGEQDKKLAEKIIADELPGVLNWALEGCRAWQAAELGIAAVIAEKTRTYRTESDVLAQWIEDECAPGPDQLAPVKQAAASYYAWCERNGERPLGRRALGEAIVARGYPSKAARYMGEVQRCYVGLRLRAVAVARPVQGQLAGIEAQGEDTDAPF